MPYNRVLVILKSYLGDAVMATPLLHGLVDQAKLDVHVLTSNLVIGLLRDTFPTTRFHGIRELSKVGELMLQASELKERNFDLAIIVNRSFRAALVSKMAKIPHRVGHSTDHRKLLLTKSESYDEFQFEAESYTQLARLAGIEIQESKPRLCVPQDVVREVRLKLGDALIGLQPGGRYAEKCIPIPVLAEVADALQQDRRVVLMGGPEEKSFGEEMMASMRSKPLNLIGELSVRESLAAATSLKLVIGGDTGFMHVAAATGTPTVTLFGPTVASKWGHHYEPHQVLVAPDRSTAKFRAEDILSAANRVFSA